MYADSGPVAGAVPVRQRWESDTLDRNVIQRTSMRRHKSMRRGRHTSAHCQKAVPRYSFPKLSVTDLHFAFRVPERRSLQHPFLTGQNVGCLFCLLTVLVMSTSVSQSTGSTSLPSYVLIPLIPPPTPKPNPLTTLILAPLHLCLRPWPTSLHFSKRTSVSNHRHQS